MKRIPVNSSNIKSVGYDPARKILEIEFRSGSVYRYWNLPQEIYRTLVSAPSIGAFFWQNIRDNEQYPREKIIG